MGDTLPFLIAAVSLSAAAIVAGLVLARQRRGLLGSRRALATTLENMSQGIVMVDANGRIAVLNQKAIDILGLPREWLDSKPTFQQVVDWQFEHGEFANESADGPKIPRTFRPLEMPGGYGAYERVRPNGIIVEVRTQVMPDGSFVRTFADITQRRRTEVALVAAQTRAAHAERLQALGQLAGGIAHDFNNVLQAVQGSASLLGKRATDPEGVRRLAGTIQDAAERGASITRRLLAFARQGELRAEPVDVVTLLSGLQEVLSHTLGGAIKVGIRFDTDLPPLLADKGQLETVLVNLATNARDAMPDGGTLTFTADLVSSGSATPDLQPGRYVHLTVADTGTGMDQATAARSTEPFFSTKPVGQGTGLGLSMTKGFVEQSGGGLLIDSVPGHGTAIHLWIPATNAPDDPLAPPKERTRFQRDGSMHILLVDDETTVRESLALFLEDTGYIVTTAPEGREALKLLASGADVDLIVTDLSMPGLDGLGLIQHARTHRPNLPAIMLTGYAGLASELAVGRSLGGSFTLLRKPVSPAQLADQIEALLAVTLPG